jgi:hypothetical protein
MGLAARKLAMLGMMVTHKPTWTATAIALRTAHGLANIGLVT